MQSQHTLANPALTPADIEAARRVIRFLEDEAERCADGSFAVALCLGMSGDIALLLADQ